MMGIQKDYMEWGGVRETQDKGRVKYLRRNKERTENMSIHIVVLYFLVVPPTVLN